MKRYADAIKLTVIPPRAATRSDTTVGLMSLANKYGSAIAAALAGGVEAVTGGMSAGILGTAAGYGVSKMIGSGVKAVQDVRSAKKAAQQFDWLNNPQAPKIPLATKAANTASIPFMAQEIENAKDKLDASKRARGGKVGSEHNPFSSAAKGSDVDRTSHTAPTLEK
jgi:hypothetical protein